MPRPVVYMVWYYYHGQVVPADNRIFPLVSEAEAYGRELMAYNREIKGYEVRLVDD